MSFYNGVLSHRCTNSNLRRGKRGLPGVGFNLDGDGNYSLQNKKLVDVATPTAQTDASTKKYVDDELNTKVAKSQIMGGNAEAGKLVKYLSDKGIITPKLYIEDGFNDSVIVKADDQDFDDVQLYIPNLKNYDGISGKRRSEIVVISTNQTITGKKMFKNSIKMGGNKIEDLPTPTAQTEAATKKIC